MQIIIDVKELKELKEMILDEIEQTAEGAIGTLLCNTEEIFDGFILQAVETSSFIELD